RRRGQGGPRPRAGPGARGARGTKHRDRRCTGRRRPRRRRRLHDAGGGAPERKRSARARGLVRRRHDGLGSAAARRRRTRARSRAVRRSELLDRRRADDAVRRPGRAVLSARRDHRAPQRGEARCAVRNRTRDGGPDRRRPRDPLGAPARPRPAPGSDLRQRGSAAHDPARHDVARLLRGRRAARPVPPRRPAAGAHGRAGRDLVKLTAVSPVLLSSDLDRSIAYYTDKLGFVCEYSDENFAIVERDDVSIFLALTTAEIVPHWQHVENMWNVYIRVEDVDAIYAELQKRSCGIDYSLYDAPHGMREFGVQDPDGHDIAFGQPR